MRSSDESEEREILAQRHLVAIVHGAVQGVGYRYFTQRCASQLGLTGYVSNHWDGTVEVVAEGKEGALLRLLASLRRGPGGAWVEKVETSWGPATGKYRRFGVKF